MFKYKTWASDDSSSSRTFLKIIEWEKQKSYKIHYKKSTILSYITTIISLSEKEKFQGKHLKQNFPKCFLLTKRKTKSFR